jgi:hypothetical protein
MVDFTQVAVQMQVRSYVPPVTFKTVEQELRKLGGELFRSGEAFNEKWLPPVRAGWLRANRAQGWADGSAYMVGQGQEVTL